MGGVLTTREKSEWEESVVRLRHRDRIAVLRVAILDVILQEFAPVITHSVVNLSHFQAISRLSSESVVNDAKGNPCYEGIIWGWKGGGHDVSREFRKKVVNAARGVL